MFDYWSCMGVDKKTKIRGYFVRTHEISEKFRLYFNLRMQDEYNIGMRAHTGMYRSYDQSICIYLLQIKQANSDTCTPSETNQTLMTDIISWKTMQYASIRS